MNSLLSLGDQKSWLRESAWFTISLAVNALHGSDVSWKEQAVEKILDTLFTTHSVWSTEKLALTLKLQDFFPSRDWKSYLSPTFKNTNILSTGNLATVAKILKVGNLSTLLVPHTHGCRNRQLTKTELKIQQRRQAEVGGLS
jgi:DNA polymerase phi